MSYYVLFCVLYLKESANKRYLNTVNNLISPNTVSQNDEKTHTAGLDDTAIAHVKIKITEIPGEKKPNTVKPPCPPRYTSGKKRLLVSSTKAVKRLYVVVLSDGISCKSHAVGLFYMPRGVSSVKNKPTTCLTSDANDFVMALVNSKPAHPTCAFVIIYYIVACKQALLFGRAKLTARERASEQRSPARGPTPRFRVFSRVSTPNANGELARTLILLSRIPKFISCVALSFKTVFGKLTDCFYQLIE